jgi:outer membrane protein assembly factor BamB
MILSPIGQPELHSQTLSDQLSSDETVQIVLDGGGVGYSSPVVAELDGDTGNGREIVVAGADGMLHVYRADGTKVWDAQLPIFSCASGKQSDKVYSSPAVGALFGDGVAYVVIGYGGFAGACDGGVAAYRGTDGNKLWEFDVAAFGRQKKHFVHIPTVFSTPALADVDGNGTLEVGFGSFDRHVYLLNADGSVRWYYHTADTVWSSPTFADIDADGQRELLIGSDITKNTFLKPATKNGGFVYAFRTNPVTGGLVEFRDPTREILIWNSFAKQVIFSSPMVADVLFTNPGLEVVVGTGCFFPEGTTNKGGKFVRILSAMTGRVLKKIKTPTCNSATPAIADLDGDGALEVVIATPSDRESGADGKGRLIAWSPETGAKLWERKIAPKFPFQSPLVADLNYDGKPEVIQATATYVYFYDGLTGSQLGRVRPGTKIQNTPVVTDFDADGRLDLVVAGAGGGAGRLTIYKNFTSDLSEERRSSQNLDPQTLIPWGSWLNASGR